MAGWPPKKNAAFVLEFPIYDADGDPVSSAAALDSEVSIDGGAFVDCTNEATEITAGDGQYALSLTAAEMNGDRIMVITKTTTSGAKTAVNLMYTSVRQIDDLAFPVTTGRGLLVESDNVVHADLKEWLGVAPLALSSQRVQSLVGAMSSGVIAAATFAAGAIDAAAIAADAIGASEIADGAIDAGAIATGAIDADALAANAIAATKIATGAITSGKFAAGAIDASAIAADAIGSSELAATAAQEIADQVWDELMSGHLTVGSFGQVLNGLGARTGEVNDVAPAAGDFDVDGFTEATNAHFAGHVLVFTSGALLGQARIISTYTGAGQNCAFDRAFTEAPADNDDFVILGGLAGGLGRLIATESDGDAHADLKQWLGTAPNALQSGRVDSYVGAFASAVIDAAAIAADAIGASELAADAVAEIADAIWDEDIVAAHGTASTAGLLLRVLGAAISTRVNNATLNALLGVADTAGTDLPEQVWAETARTLTALGFVLAAADIGTDAIGAAELATDAVNEIRDAILSDSTPFAGAAITEVRLSELDAGTAGKMAAEVDIIKAGVVAVTGAVNDVAATTTDFDTDGFTEASDDHFNGHWLVFTSGALAGQARMIRDYTGTGQNVAFDRALTEAPADNDTFTILAVQSGAWETILARLTDVEGESAVSNRMVLWAVAKLVNKVDASTTTVSIKKTDDTTQLFSQTATVDSGADPITVLDTA